MENLRPKIEFYRQRTFSEKMNVVFAFIRENWKPLLKYSFYLIMPICLIQTFAMNAFVNVAFNVGFNAGANAATGASGLNPFGDSLASFISSYGVLMCCTMIGSGILSGLVYALMETYSSRENRLQDVTLSDFKDLLVKNAWKYIRLMFAIITVYVLIVVVLALLAAYVTAWTLIVTIPVALLCTLALIPLLMVAPAYIFERDITFVGAFRKAWKLGMATLGGMIGLMIVLSFISSVIQSITMMPWYLLSIIGNIFSTTSESMMSQSVAYKFAQYILGLIQSYGSYVASIIGAIGLAFQYFHAREKLEGVTIESNISNFSKL